MFHLLYKFKDFIRFESSKLKVYGLTHHTTKNEYMLLFDEFGFKWRWYNGNVQTATGITHQKLGV